MNSDTVRPELPPSIPDDSWRRMERTRYLRDITDVILDGGGFWEAIELALEDEFPA